jgi:hypothetical protein
MSTLLHVSLIPTSYNRLSAYQLQRSAIEHSSTREQATRGLVPISYKGALLSTLLHVSLISTSHNRPSTYQLQRSTTEHSSTCHCTNFNTICRIYLYRLQIKWDYKRKIISHLYYTGTTWQIMHPVMLCSF